MGKRSKWICLLMFILTFGKDGHDFQPIRRYSSSAVCTKCGEKGLINWY